MNNSNRYIKTGGVITSLLIFLFCLNLDGYSQKVKLSVNLNKGDKFTYRIDNKTITIQTIMGTEQVILNQEETEYDFMVKDINQEGNFNIEVVYKRVKLLTETENIKMDFDTDEPSDSINPVFSFIAALPGKSFDIVVTPTGDVLDLIGPNEFVDQISDSVNLDENMKKALLVRYGKDQTFSYFKTYFCNYSKKTLKEGHTWPKIKTGLHGFHYISDNLWKLEKFDANIADLRFEGEIKSDKEKPVKIDNIQLYYDVQGNQKGSSTVNITNGLIKKSTINQTFAGNIRVKGMEVPESYKWSVEIEMTTTIEMK